MNIKNIRESKRNNMKKTHATFGRLSNTLTIEYTKIMRD